VGSGRYRSRFCIVFTPHNIASLRLKYLEDKLQFQVESAIGRVDYSAGSCDFVDPMTSSARLRILATSRVSTRIGSDQ